MGLWQSLKGWIAKALSLKEEQTRQRALESPRARHLPPRHFLSEPGGNGPRKQFGYEAETLRMFARTSPTLRTVIDIRKREVASARWEIAPNTDFHEKELDWLRQLVQSVHRFPDRQRHLDSFRPSYLPGWLVREVLEATKSKALKTDEIKYRFTLALQDMIHELEKGASAIRKLFQNPNPSVSWADILRAVVPDLLILDSGCMELRRRLLPVDEEQAKQGRILADPRNPILEIHWVDGATVRPCIDENGQLRDISDGSAWAYEQWIRGERIASGGWRRMDLLRLVENPQTDVAWLGYGISRVETLVLTCMLDAMGDKADMEEFKREFFGGFLNVNDASFQQADIAAWRKWLEAEIEGTRKLPITAFEKLTYVPVHSDSNNRDKRGSERRKGYQERICSIFEISKTKLAISEHDNRATAEVSGEQMDDGLVHLLDVIDQGITQGIVQAFGRTDLVYRSSPRHGRDEKARLENDEKKAKLGIYNVNDIRMLWGREPIDEGGYSLWYFEEFEKERGRGAAAPPMPGLGGDPGSPLSEGEDAPNLPADQNQNGVPDHLEGDGDPDPTLFD